MRKRLHKTIIAALLAGTAALSCLPNPEGPVLDPPGTVLLFDANFNSIQLNGDFMPGGNDGWDAADLRHDMKLVDNNEWALDVALLDAHLSEIPPEIQFKFTHDHSWEPDRWNATATEGQAELSNGDGQGNIALSIGEGRGFYTITFNDESHQYGTEPAKATGLLAGSLDFDGAAPDGGAEIALVAENEHGNTDLWTLSPVDGDFEFAGLADSLYTLRASASGYASQTLSGIRVEGGAAPAQAITLSQVFGAISGTVSFENVAAAPYPEAIVVAVEQGTMVEAGRDTSDVDTGDYLIEGLGTAIFDLQFSAPDYSDASLSGIVVEGDAEVTGQDVTLLEMPWFIPVIDGAIDEGWPSVVDDGGHNSNWGAANNIHTLHVSWDDERLYLGVAGVAEGGNAIVTFLDTDYGAGSGLTSFQVISGLGNIGDNFLRTNMNTGLTPGFGAEIGIAAKGDGTELGVCDLSTPGNIALIDDAVIVKGADAVEFSIPWIAVAPDAGGALPEGAELALFCFISGGAPGWFSDDFLPPLGYDLPVVEQSDWPLPAGNLHTITITVE